MCRKNDRNRPACDAGAGLPFTPVQRETREPTAGMLASRPARRRSAGRRHADLHLHYTMANCLGPEKKHGVTVIVCDRPNPIGADAVEGPMLVPGSSRSSGSIPADAARHDDRRAARLFNDEFGIGADSRGRPRRAGAEGCTSMRPVFPSCCRRRTSPRSTRRSSIGNRAVRRNQRLRRARDDESRSNCSGAVGRRGALRRRMNALGLRGVRFRPTVIEPTFHKHAQVAAAAARSRPRSRGLRPVEAASRSSPRSRGGFRSLRWRDPPYEYDTGCLPTTSSRARPELRAAD